MAARHNFVAEVCFTDIHKHDLPASHRLQPKKESEREARASGTSTLSPEQRERKLTALDSSWSRTESLITASWEPGLHRAAFGPYTGLSRLAWKEIPVLAICILP